MTKPVLTAITLKLNESQTFGPRGLDTPVTELLPARLIRELTVGSNARVPRCPGSTWLLNRESSQFEFSSFLCPDLSRVTLRNLMTANHGMYDFLNEVAEPDGNFLWSKVQYPEFFASLGIDPAPKIAPANGQEYLKAIGLKTDPGAQIGGTRARDFEASFGNTGFQLLGIILEERTGKSLNNLIRKLIVEPLNLDPIFIRLRREVDGVLISEQYEGVWGNGSDIMASGLYPLTTFHGQDSINTKWLGSGRPANLNFAGGAGGLVANPKSYRRFFEALLDPEGILLSPASHAELERSFIPLPEFDTPYWTFAYALGVVRLRLTGHPRLPDVDLLTHDGLLYGVRCTNSVVRPHNSTRLIAVGAICQNSNGYGPGDPNIFALDDAFISELFRASVAAAR